MVLILITILAQLASSNILYVTPTAGLPMDCTCSGKKTSVVITFDGNPTLGSLPGKYITDGTNLLQTCYISGMTIDVALGASVTGIFEADSSGVLFVNGVPTPLANSAWKTAKSADITSFFPTPGTYNLSINTTHTSGRWAGVGFLLTETYSCDPSCLVCLPLSCSQCAISGAVISGSICQCPLSTYLVSKACVSCGSLCAVCATASTCNKCIDNATLKNGQCSCNNGYFISENTCVPCPTTCATCQSATVCNSCIYNAFLSHRQCSCNSGYFLSSGACLSCTSLCSQCFSKLGCQGCIDDSLEEVPQCHYNIGYEITYESLT